MILSLITVSYNSGEKLLAQIQSVIKASEGLSYEHIISDNGSTDGSIEQVRKQFSQVKIIENGGNLGFAKANNNALALTSGKFLLFLNPDMRLTSKSLSTLVNWMEQHPKVGIASCKLTDEYGNFNHQSTPRRFPRLSDQVAILLKLPHIFPSILNHYLYAGFNPDIEQEVDSVQGSFLLTRREIITKLGWAFDPRYFIWFEDVDLCREVHKRGYTIMYSPIISCVDYIGQSFKHQTLYWKQKQVSKSMLQYFKKWHPWYEWMWIALLRPIILIMAWGYGKVTPHDENPSLSQRSL